MTPEQRRACDIAAGRLHEAGEIFLRCGNPRLSRELGGLVSELLVAEPAEALIQVAEILTGGAS